MFFICFSTLRIILFVSLKILSISETSEEISFICSFFIESLLFCMESSYNFY